MFKLKKGGENLGDVLKLALLSDVSRKKGCFFFFFFLLSPGE